MHRFIALLFLASVQLGAAATYTWKGGSGAWNITSANWTGLQTIWPVSGTDNDAVFPVPAGTLSLASNIVVNDFAFQTSYRLQDGQITLNGSSPTFTIPADNTATVATPLTGSTSLTKAGTGTLSLRRANTYSANTVINGGTLKVTGGGRLYYGAHTDAANVIIGPGATLELDSWTYGDSQSLGRLGTIGDRIVINGGTIRVNGITGSGRGVTINSEGATFEAAAGADWMIHTFTENWDFIYNGNPSIVLTGAGIGRFEKPFSGTGSVTKRGPGQWTLRRSNSYTGNTTVEQGVLTLIRPSLADGSTVTVFRGAVVNLMFAGGDAIGRLVLGGVTMPNGTYNRTTHPSYFTGIGSLVVGGPATTATPPYNYGLASGSDGWPANIRQDITNGMNYAVGMYNSYGYFPAYITATYNSGVPTAQCGYGSWLEFGGMRSGRVAMHEMGHFFGVGTYWAWGSHLANGQWTGINALNLVRQIDGPDATLYSDGTHFWPYGLNYDNESSTRNDTVHVRIMDAFRRDMGLVNAAPTISAPARCAVARNASSASLAFTVGDAETAAASLAVTTSSSNPSLVPSESIVLGGAGATRTVTFTPVENLTGTATITLMVMDGLDTTTTSIQVGVGTLTVPIASSADDAEESASGAVNLTSSDLEFVNDDATGAGDQVVGLRFAEVQLPPGALITSATIQFATDEEQTGVTKLNIAVESTDNAPAFATNAHNLTQRFTTGISVPWEPGTWELVGETTTAQRTPNVAALVQEIVNRPGWVSGNALAFLISGSGHRTAEAFDSGGTPPQLIVNFVMPTPAVTVSINTSANDAEESASGAVNLTSSDLELVNDSDTGAGNQIVGLRFKNLAVPPGATVTSARLQFRADEIQSEATALSIRAEAADYAVAFVTNAHNLSSRVLTPAVVAWNPPPWTSVGESTAAQRSPDLSSLVQDVVKRPGWTNGSTIALFISGTGHRTADAFDKAGATPASLTVTYSLGVPPIGSFAEWIATFPSLTGSDAQPEADPEGDGFNNLAEFALALNPTQPNSSPFVVACAAASLSLHYTRRSIATGITYSAEWSESLAPGSWSGAGVTQQILADDGITRTVRASVTTGTTSQRFLRLKVAAP